MRSRAWKKHGRPLSGALLSGGLCILAFPGSPLPLLALVCMTPWLASVRSAPPSVGVISGLLVGSLYAIPCTWDGIYTAAHTLNVGAARAGFLTGLFFIPYLLPFAVVGWYAAISKATGIRWACRVSLLWIATMSVAPTLFPVTPGLMLHGFPVAIQLADLGGVPLVNLVLLLINALLAEILRLLWTRRRPFREVGYVAVIIALAAGYGWLRLTAFRAEASDPAERTITVALIQPNLPRGVNEVGLIRDNRTEVLSALEMTRQVLKTSRIDLAVFPESPVGASCAESALTFRKLSAVAAETGVSFLYQCVDCQDNVCYNAARLALPHEPSPPPYHKRALIPFLEARPANWAYRLAAGLIPVTRDLQTGTEKMIFRMEQDFRVMPLICYDVHFSELVREGDPGDVLAVMANDQRFGPSRIGYLDYVMTIFRAVEIRRPLVRVANTGPSAIIQANGETVPHTLTPAYQPAARTAALPIFRVQTVYARCGHLVVYVFACGVLGEMMIGALQKRASVREQKK